MMSVLPGAEPNWAWAAIGVDSRRARGTSQSAGEAMASAIAAVGELMLLELRGPDGCVKRCGKIVERTNLWLDT